MNELIDLGGADWVAVRCSVGIAADQRGLAASQLLHAADVALYEAKSRGKTRRRRSPPNARNARSLKGEFVRFRPSKKRPVILSGASLRAQSKDPSLSSGIRREAGSFVVPPQNDNYSGTDRHLRYGALQEGAPGCKWPSTTCTFCCCLAPSVRRSSGSSSSPSNTSSALDDPAAFAELTDRYRHQLHVHCYRMLGSFDDAEDLVQETFLRAWRARASFESRSLVRTWLYRIATNACLNALERAPRRVLPQDVAPPVTGASDPSAARDEPSWAPELPWLQPYPDKLLDAPSPADSGPEDAVASRETIELAYLAALQHLPARQRAILILRDVLGWSAAEVAGMLELSVAAVNSAHQRARSTMRAHLPSGRESWAAGEPRSDEERAALREFMAAWERSDASRLTSLLREDARWAMPPAPLWFDGRAAVEMLFRLFPPSASGEFRTLPTAANRQPAVAAYLRRPGDALFRFAGVQVLRIEGGAIAEVISFGESLCKHFELPATLG